MYKHKVQYYETDMMGITHHSNYVRWMEEARTSYLETLGWPYARMEKEGLISPTISIECKYKKTTTYDDVVEITPVIEEFKGIKIRLKYIMTNDKNEVVCEAKSEHCFVDRDGKPVAIKKVRPDLYKVIMDAVVTE